MSATGKTITATIFDAVSDHSRPAFTFYDDATGERTELSWATLGNWAAKTANFLTLEAGIQPGDAVVVALPEHWQSAGILLGCWWAGANVFVSEDDSPTTQLETARVVFADRGAIAAYPDADELVIASLDPFALPIAGLPPGVSDYGSRVRVHGDGFAGPRYDGRALGGATTPDVLDAARAAAAANHIEAGLRVLTTREWRTADGIVATMLAPLTVGASVVWVANPADDLAHRAETERADVVLR